MNREFLQKCHKYNEAKYCIAGWFYSEKMDGQTGFWDGGVTRGILKSDVPWANTDKDSRFITPPVSTGLWTNYANVIHAPDWWLDTLPNIPFVGELHNHKRGIAERQRLMKIVRTIRPGSGWNEVIFNIFDMPSFKEIFRPGRVNTNHFQHTFTYEEQQWMLARENQLCYIPKDYNPYFINYKKLSQLISTSNTKYIKPIKQTLLPFKTAEAVAILKSELERIESLGGEGLIIRNKDQTYRTIRTHHCLKLKTDDDAEATVIGYVTGRETDKGSKLLGMMGAAIVDFNGIIFELSGFTESERNLTYTISNKGSAAIWAAGNPETKCPDTIHNPMFQRGTQITFKYRGLSRDGVPQEARYWRKREDE